MSDQKVRKADNMAEVYLKRYRPQVEALESKSLLSKARSINSFDIAALGQQLDQWEEYKEFVLAEAGNLNNLGKLPKIALDVISVAYGNSVLPVIASVQPIQEQRGIVYFKNLRAADTKGNLTAGETMVDVKTGAKTSVGYASNELVDIEFLSDADFDGTEVDFIINLVAKPVLRETFKAVLTGGSILCEDVGPAEGADQNIGRIFGSGVSGTINYTTGVVNLTFAAAPAATGVSLIGEYQQNYESATDIPKIESFMDSTDVSAKVYALKGTIGMLQSYAMKKRFGASAMEDELSKTLVAEINKEIGGDMIRKLRAGSLAGVTFDKTVPTGAAYSRADHYNDIMVTKSEAEQKIVEATQRGSVSVIVCGTEQAGIWSNVRGFELLYDDTKIGPHVYGRVGNIVIVRVPEAAILASKNGFGLHKGMNPWENAAIYAPYMPLATTDMLPEAPNPLVNQRAAACMAATKAVIPSFAVKLDVTAS